MSTIEIPTPRSGPRTALWFAGTTAFLAVWVLVYRQLVPFSDWAVSLLLLAPGSHGVSIQVEKVTDYAAIAGYGIASTPGIIIDGKVVHAGGQPKAEDLARWLAA